MITFIQTTLESKWFSWLLMGAVISILTFILGWMAYLLIARPARTPLTQELFQGVTYTRQILDEPRDLVMHIVEIDRTDPELSFLVTPSNGTGDDEYLAQYTTTFLEENQLQLAINGDFFDPFFGLTPVNYYPKVGDPVNVFAPAISNGEEVNSLEDDRPIFCVTPAEVVFAIGVCPAETVQAMGGNPIFLIDGVYEDELIQRRHYFRDPEPRTIIAADESGDTIWFILIDGRQQGYSEGIGLQELTPMLLDMGVANAINLDGGGSVTLAVEDPRTGQATILNSPVHTRLPLRERPIANHIGIFAAPLDAPLAN